MKHISCLPALAALVAACLATAVPLRAPLAEPWPGIAPGAPAEAGKRPLYALFSVPPAAGQRVAFQRPSMPPPMAGQPPKADFRPAPVAGSASSVTAHSAPGDSCRAAIAAAAGRYGIPPRLLLAIAMVESGGTDPATGEKAPWPWAANTGGRGYRFGSAAEASAWVREKQAVGVRSIDTGCMQVNLMHHPDAFATPEEAFDPGNNADYAAQFLLSLHDGPAGGDWMRAAGFYHSQTPGRAESYRGLVEAAMGEPMPVAQPVVVAGGGGESLTNHAERARILPMPNGQAGRGLDAYRAMPILIASRALSMPLRR